MALPARKDFGPRSTLLAAELGALEVLLKCLESKETKFIFFVPNLCCFCLPAVVVKERVPFV